MRASPKTRVPGTPCQQGTGRAQDKASSQPTESTPIKVTSPRQAPGQLLRAAALVEQADRAARFGAWQVARRLRHQANLLRRRARGTRPNNPVVVERQLAAARLDRWAGRSAT